MKVYKVNVHLRQLYSLSFLIFPLLNVLPLAVMLMLWLQCFDSLTWNQHREEILSFFFFFYDAYLQHACFGSVTEVLKPDRTIQQEGFSYSNPYICIFPGLLQYIKDTPVFLHVTTIFQNETFLRCKCKIHTYKQYYLLYFDIYIYFILFVPILFQYYTISNLWTAHLHFSTTTYTYTITKPKGLYVLVICNINVYIYIVCFSRHDGGVVSFLPHISP